MQHLTYGIPAHSGLHGILYVGHVDSKTRRLPSIDGNVQVWLPEMAEQLHVMHALDSDITATTSSPFGAVTGALVRYVRAVAGEPGVLRMLALAGESRFGTELEAPDAGSSCDQMVTLFHAAAQVTGDGAVGFHVGSR